MPDAIRDLVIKIAIQQTGVKLRAPDFGPILLPVQEFQKKTTASFDNITDKVDDLGEEIADLKPKLEEVGIASGEARQKLADDTLKMGEGFRTAGEGAFTLARGIAFVGIAGEEDLAKVVQTIAKFQGAFDIFKGGIDVVKGLTEGTRALRTVTASAAVAETGLAAANTAVATTGAAATTSMRALMATLGPIALAASAVGVAFLIFRDAPDDIDDTTGALERQRKILRQIADDKRQGVFDEPLAIFLLSEGLLSLEDQLDLIQDKIKKFTPALQEAFADPSKDFAVSALPSLKEFVQLEKDRLGILKQQKAELQSAHDIAASDLATAKQRIDIERGKLQTAKERFGLLSKEDQLQLGRIGKRFETGGAAALSIEEAQLASRVLGGVGGRRILSERASIQADVAGFGKVSGLLGAGAGIEQAEAIAREAQEKLGGADGLITTLTGSLELITTNIDSLREIIIQTLKKQSDLEARIDKLNN